MEKTINQEDFLNSLFALLDETFETHHGIYLDKNTRSSKLLKRFPLKKPPSRSATSALRWRHR